MSVLICPMTVVSAWMSAVREAPVGRSLMTAVPTTTTTPTTTRKARRRNQGALAGADPGVGGGVPGDAVEAEV
jgi:hypothetical protein